MSDPRLRLLHIRQSIHRIEVYTRDGRDAFLGDQRTIDAVIRNFEIIGEAVRRLPEKLKSRDANVPWKQIADFRNFLIHVYDAVDPMKVWPIVEHHLPALRDAVDRLLDEADPKPPLFSPTT